MVMRIRVLPNLRNQREIHPFPLAVSGGLLHGTPVSEFYADNIGLIIRRVVASPNGKLIEFHSKQRTIIRELFIYRIGDEKMSEDLL
jgi:hypothetical protein